MSIENQLVSTRMHYGEGELMAEEISYRRLVLIAGTVNCSFIEQDTNVCCFNTIAKSKKVAILFSGVLFGPFLNIFTTIYKFLCGFFIVRYLFFRYFVAQIASFIIFSTSSMIDLNPLFS